MSKEKPKRKLVVFSIGGKGGVGKSWLIELLVDWYLSQGVKFLALDLDNENSTLSRFYPGAEFIEVSSEKDLDAMLERIVESETLLTILDMRAASTDRISPWLSKVDFESLRDDHGISFTAVGVVDSSTDSVANIGYWANEVLKGNRDIKFIIAQNKVRGEDLSYLESADRAAYQKTLDVAEIEIPKLEEWIHQKLEVDDLRVGAALAIQDEKSPFTKFMTRSRLKKYQQAVFSELAKVKDRLLP